MVRLAMLHQALARELFLLLRVHQRGGHFTLKLTLSVLTSAKV